MVSRKRPLYDRVRSSQGAPPVTVFENTGHGVQLCQAVHDDSASRNAVVNAHHKGRATKEKSVCDESVPSRTRSSARKKPRHAIMYRRDKHVINEKPEETKHLVDTTSVLSAKDDMAGVKIDVNHEVNGKPEGTKQIMQTEEKSVCDGSVPSRTQSSARKKPRHAIMYRRDKHVINEKPEETKHLVDTTSVLSAKDDMAGVKIDVNHEVNGKPEGTKQIMQTEEKSVCDGSVPSRTRSSARKKPRHAIMYRRDKHVINEKLEETKHLVDTTSVLSAKDDMAGVKIDVNHEVNGKPEGTKQIMQTEEKSVCDGSVPSRTRSSARKKPRHAIMYRRDKHVINEKPEETKHLVDTTSVLSAKDEMAGVKIDVNHVVSENPEGTKQIMQTEEKSGCDGSVPSRTRSSARKKPRHAIMYRRDKHVINEKPEETKHLADTTSVLSAKDEMAGVKIDVNHVVNENLEGTKQIVQTDSKKRIKKRTKEKKIDHGVESMTKEMTDLSHNVAVVEKEEIDGEKTPVEAASKRAVKSTQEEVMDTSSQRLPICCIGETSLDHQSVASVSVATDNMSTVEPKIEVSRAVLANEHPVEEEVIKNHVWSYFS
ncbi:hypothetical protein RND81_08G006600 [Saponaria officinalis]|uniref:Uncharacterized protein n=1 Tax=Saponaria officinalis TaxID=3572 RepID=A0AAW1J1S2_SAPOF